MLRLGVADVAETAVADDADSGILCGRRAGAGLVAGVLTGAHSSDRLRRAGATHLIPTIAHLPELLHVAGDPAPGLGPGAPAAGTPPSPRMPIRSLPAVNNRKPTPPLLVHPPAAVIHT